MSEQQHGGRAMCNHGNGGGHLHLLDAQLHFQYVGDGDLHRHVLQKQANVQTPLKPRMSRQYQEESETLKF